MNNCIGENYYSELYHGFFKFYMKLLSEFEKHSYDFVILTTRRCFCLFNGVKNDVKFKELYTDWFVGKQKKIAELDRHIFSSQDIDTIGEEFKSKSVLLVDDVMIHGKTVYCFFQRIKEYNPKRIDTFVFVRKIENPDYYFFKTKKPYKFLYEKESYDWKRLSNIIVSYLHYVGQLYVSFVYGFRVSSQKVLSIDQNDDLKKCLVDYNSFFSHNYFLYSNEPVYYVYKGFSKFSCVSKAFLRVYQREKDDCQIIPFVELKPMSEVCAIRAWNLIWKSGAVPEELKTISSVVDIYKSLMVVCSVEMYKSLFGNAMIISTPEIDKSYTKDFFEILRKKINNNVISIIDLAYQESQSLNLDSFVFKNSIMFKSLSNEAFSNGIDVRNLEHYFHLVTTAEENTYVQNISQGIQNGLLYFDKNESIETQPLPIGCLEAMIKRGEEDETKSMLLYLLDIGVASILVEYREGIVGLVVKAGEQSYHLFSDLAGTSCRAVYILLDFIEHFKKDRRSSFVEQFLQRIKLHNRHDLIQNFDNVEWIIRNPPAQLRSDYFGALSAGDNCMTESEIETEQQIVDLFVEVIKECV